MAQIEFKNVTKEYEDSFLALDDVSLSINKGEFVFLIGPSGAGKSTLVKLLIREELPTSGEIFFNEENILEIPQTKVHSLRRRIGVVFQDFKILMSKTVFENVAVALEVTESPKSVIDEVVPNVLNLVGLESKINVLPHKLSGGEKQRLAIARALAHEPDVLVADEPTGMIDPKSAGEVVKILERVNSMGTTLLMTTHDQSIVNRLKKRVVRIENGKITSDEKKGEYKSEQILYE